MKVIYRYIKPLSSVVLVVILLSMTSCREEYPVYNQPEDFVSFSPDEGGLRSYSFIFKEADIKKDTVWFTVRLEGSIMNRDRYFSVKQEIPKSDTTKNAPVIKPENQYIEAVPGKHYVSFDDPAYKKFLVIPANAREAKFPVIILRDPSIKEQKGVRLGIEIVKSKDFNPGYISLRKETLLISDRLIRPTLWLDTQGILYYYLGVYGPIKHRFMIDVTHQHWDDDFIRANYFNNYMKADQQYLGALVQTLKTALRKENAKRKVNGKAPLTEADGTQVRFRFGF